MRTRIDAARLRIRPIWLIAAATCFIPTLLISDASLKTADARMMMGERPTMGQGSRMGGGHRSHGGGHRSHGHRGGHRSYGFSGGSAVGMGLAIGGMVIDQMQRAQARDGDYDEPRDAPARSYVDKPRNTTAVSKPKKQEPSSVARKKKDEPVYAKGKSDTLYAKKQDTPYHGSGSRGDPRDAPVARRGDPRDVPVAYGDPRDVPVFRRDDPRDVPVANDDPRDVPTRTTTREPGLKPPPEYPTGRPPVPSLVPPSTPFLVSNPVPEIPLAPPAARCEDCRELWLEIKRYEKQIADDEKKLAREEKKLERRKQERDELEAKIRKAKGPLKQELEKRLKKVNESIDWLTEWNDELRDIIKEEKEVKASLEEAYDKCADPQCREKTVDTPEAPKEPEPSPEQPRDTPVTSIPNPTPVVLTPGRPEPPPASTPASGPCVDHWAELTNSKRVFHRLYVLGTPNSQKERENWLAIRDYLKAGLEGPGRQAPQSTSKDMNEPTLAEFRSEMQRLAEIVQPCEEVTLYLGGHGGGGNTHGWELPPLTPGGETKAEFFSMKKTYDKNTGELIRSEYQGLFDRDLGEMIKQFKPNVSVTVLVSSCWGGGFAGKGNVEESKLVKVIGLFTQCTGNFDVEIRKGVDGLAGKSKDGRVTAIEIKDHLLQKGWPLGEPFDSPLDNYVNERLGEYLPR
jgi:hypothetical protein